LAKRWETVLERWQSAGFIDAPTAGRIRGFESSLPENQGLHWPAILAISFGGLMLGAGVLLFVAAHWDQLSPAQRLFSVVLLVAVFHVLGAFTSDEFPNLATVFHAVGTIALGAGIFLTAQIFNLNEDWSGGVLLWALGAALGWAIRRDWVQAMFTALLVPLWLSGKWMDITRGTRGREAVLAEGLLMLAISYLTARGPGESSPLRRALSWIGAIALLPCVAFVVAGEFEYGNLHSMMAGKQLLGWIAAIGVPLLMAFLLRGSAAWMNVLACVWVMILGTMDYSYSGRNRTGISYFYNEIAPFLWCLAGSVGLIAWGLREGRKERINFGVAGFGFTILWFYFSSVMDKLGRSESLIGFGVIFLIGGWFLERARRRLVANLHEVP
jgi:Predicted membrane protein (DUF2157)